MPTRFRQPRGDTNHSHCYHHCPGSNINIDLGKHESVEANPERSVHRIQDGFSVSAQFSPDRTGDRCEEYRENRGDECKRVQSCLSPQSRPTPVSYESIGSPEVESS